MAFKNKGSFINCIPKINGVLIDNAEDLHVVMPMYNLLEYSKIYRKITGSLWNYYRDEPSDPLSFNFESFKYKTSITGNSYNLVAGDDGYDANKVAKSEANFFCTTKTFKQFLESLRHTFN